MRARLGEFRRARPAGARPVEEPLPRRRTCRMVVDVVPLDLGDPLQEYRVRRVAGVEASQQIERTLRLLLVPEVEPVELVVRLGAQQHAPVAGLEHLLQAFLSVAARQEQQPPHHPGCRRGDGDVVVIQADAELGVVQRGVQGEGALERRSDAVALARGGQPLAAQYTPLHERRIGAREIEPRLRALRLTLRPGGRRRNRVRGHRLEARVERPAVWVEDDLPPDRDGGQRLAGFNRGWRTGGGQELARAIESRAEDLVVHRRESVAFGEAGRRRHAVAAPEEDERDDDGSDPGGDGRRGGRL